MRRRIESWTGLLVGLGVAFAARLVYGKPSFAFAFVAIIAMAVANIVGNRILARRGAPPIPLVDLGRTYAKEAAGRPVLVTALEAALMTTTVVTGILALGLPIDDLMGMASFLAVVPVIAVLSGFVRAIQARRNARALASLPDTPASPAARRTAFLKWLGRLPLVYAGTILGVAVGALASLRLQWPLGYAVFLICSVAGMSAPYLILRENPLVSVAPNREPRVLRGLVMSVLAGMLGWGVPFGIVMAGYFLLPVVLEMLSRTLPVDTPLLHFAATISIAGGAIFGFIMWLFVMAIFWTLPKKSPQADLDH